MPLSESLKSSQTKISQEAVSRVIQPITVCANVKCITPDKGLTRGSVGKSNMWKWITDRSRTFLERNGVLESAVPKQLLMTQKLCTYQLSNTGSLKSAMAGIFAPRAPPHHHISVPCPPSESLFTSTALLDMKMGIHKCATGCAWKTGISVGICL